MARENGFKEILKIAIPEDYKPLRKEEAGVFHTKFGISVILFGILTQLILLFCKPEDYIPEGNFSFVYWEV